MTATPTRRHQVEHLLRSLLDYLPTPNRDSTAPRHASAPGPAPGKRTRCQRCDTTGRVKGDQPCQQCRTAKARTDEAGKRWDAHAAVHGCRLCLACDGTGHVKTRQGDEAVDEMLTPGRTDQHDQAYERAEQRRRVEAELTRLTRLQAVRDDGEAADWWLSAADRRRRAQWRATSHAELWALLEQLRDIAPIRYSVVMRKLVYGQEVVFSPRMQARLDETLDWLAERMPERILAPGAVLPTPANGEAMHRQRKGPAVKERWRRDERLRKAFGLRGLSIRAAAVELGLPKSTLARIVSPPGDGQETMGGTAA